MTQETQSKHRIILAMVSILLGLVITSLALTAQFLVVNAALLCVLFLAAFLAVKILTASRDDNARILIMVLGFLFGTVVVILVPALRLTSLETDQLVLFLIALYLAYKV